MLQNGTAREFHHAGTASGVGSSNQIDVITAVYAASCHEGGPEILRCFKDLFKEILRHLRFLVHPIMYTVVFYIPGGCLWFMDHQQQFKVLRPRLG